MDQVDQEIGINSLLELVSKFKSGEYEIVKNLKELNITFDEVKDYLFWSDNKYTRNCIAHNDEFELVALCWEPGQYTAIHSHNEQECFVKVVKGTFEELKFEYQPDSESMIQFSKEVLEEQSLSINGSDEPYHSLKNVSNDRAVTLHLYMSPIKECLVFDRKSSQLQTKQLSYHSEDGVLL